MESPELKNEMFANEFYFAAEKRSEDENDFPRYSRDFCVEKVTRVGLSRVNFSE